MRVNVSLGAVFRVALYYGFAGFGGGYSVLAQLRRDLVERRKWLSGDDFLVLAELSMSLPGTPYCPKLDRRAFELYCARCEGLGWGGSGRSC